MIRLRQVSKGYLEGGQWRQILNGVDLHVRRASFVCLTGRSGSGKSTLLNVISGIDSPDAGQVSIDGTALESLDDRARTLYRRKHLGFVFQAFNLVPTLTVAENLALPQELNGQVDAQHSLNWLAQIGLAARGRSFPDELSGGEQQRVAIARALVHAPSLLLADEPTGNLDQRTGEQILDILETLCRDSGTTLLVASHSAEVARRAHRVIELRDGSLRCAAAP
jgi:putative ABC transport system ATP-binding protein